MRAWPTGGPAGSRGGKGRHVMSRLAIALLVSAGLAAQGCGGMGTPDLSHGVLTGRINGAVTAKAYVYPLGAPQQKVAVAADGSFRLAASADTRAVVLWDGSGDPAAATPTGLGRAQLLPVEVRGSDEVNLGEFHGEGSTVSEQQKMPLAGGVLAGASTPTGELCRDPAFEVEGTDQRKVAVGTVPAEYLAPLPGGAYKLRVEMAGFQTKEVDIVVTPGATTPADVGLDIDDHGGSRGCAVTGCPEGFTCDTGSGTCQAPVVQGCGASCGGGGSASCPAGQSCQSGTCSPPRGVEKCGYWAAAFGASCTSDDPCRSWLSGGTCLRGETYAGYCTARCDGQAQCDAIPTPPGATFAWVCTAGFCQKQ